jgi:NAD(P)-dependent dehydrogenase (short-subunit alcohol dehydrogenase family)
MITGASGNLSAALVQKYFKAGAKLVLLARSPEKLRDLYPQISQKTDRILIQKVDLTDPNLLDRAVENAKQQFGRIDVLLNTVGGFRAGDSLHETSLDTLNLMFTLNFESVFIACKAVIPTMLDQNYGKIINIAARPGLKGIAYGSAYSAAKSGVIRLTESMSAELKFKGINVNCVLPGTINTPQNRQSMPDSDFNRWVKPEQIANVILFLTSDYASAINGAVIPVYGQS